MPPRSRAEERRVAGWPIDPELVIHANQKRADALERDYDTLGERLARSGIAIDAVSERLTRFGVAIPTWGVGSGGTRFARFPLPGEPRDVFEKLEDCALIWQLSRATPTLSPHFPWDEVAEPAELRARAAVFGLAFDAVNSNTFQDLPGQRYSYKFGSLAHTDSTVREQAIAHNLSASARRSAGRRHSRLDRRRPGFPASSISRALSRATSTACEGSTCSFPRTGTSTSSTSSTSRRCTRR
jgi:hypothetical protein